MFDFMLHIERALSLAFLLETILEQIEKPKIIFSV